MAAASARPVSCLRVDGGASAMDLLLQLVADQVDVRVDRARVQETTALGAAYLAGLGAGQWASPEEVAGRWELDRTFTPTGDRDAADAGYAQWRRAVERSRAWAAP